jgi:hypothetical protein
MANNLIIRGSGAIVTAPPSFVEETPAGTQNSTNVTFTLSFTPAPIASLELKLNGVFQVPTTDFTISGATITFVTAPRSYDKMTATYTH